MAKQAKYEGLLDSLPDSIICHILSFLPTRDAVRTSVLSPMWRHLFTLSISKLDVNDCLPEPEVSAEGIESFKKFMDRHPANLQSSVYLLVAGDTKIGYRRRCMEVPTNVCLPNLRTLRLSSIDFVYGCSLLGLISGCPVLEDLGVFACSIDGASELNIHSLSLKRLALDFQHLHLVHSDGFDWLIDAPSLVYFKYIRRGGRGYAMRNMESLEKADITIFNFNNVDRERSAALLQGICNVQVLHLFIIDQDAPLIRTPTDPVLAFNKLLKLRFKNHGDRRTLSVTWMLEFLYRAPNLKTLILDLADADGVSESLPEQVPSCLLYGLKEIRIVSFKGETDTHMLKLKDEVSMDHCN
ncbi:hypothetical protein V6N12_001079 [Hibiscus sabdariffa]|uniref:F-box domain-containing protein n=1 Tax=Hibiscus sabdariffa TaxID=183260 RepID=A0ABR2C671_9ROSI